MDPPTLSNSSRQPPSDPPPPPPTEISIPTEHSLPTAEQMRTEAVISEIGNSSDVKNRRKFRILVAVCTLAVITIIGFSVGIAKNNGKSSSSPSSVRSGSGSSSSDVSSGSGSGSGPINKISRLQEVQDFLSFFSSREALEERGSPQYLASEWIADEDTQQVDLPDSESYADAFRFVQRYVLALLYFSTSGPSWTHETRLRWLSDRSECDWNFDLSSGTSLPSSGMTEWTMGVQCDDEGEVDYIYLPANNLEGTLPYEFGELIALKHLSLYDNKLSGPLPSDMADLTDLTFLAMESNKFSGPVPDWINKFTKLKYLALGNNEFTGQLPSFDQLKKLREVALDHNRLTGTVDVFNGNSDMKSIFLQKNELTQELSDDLFKDLTGLQTLDMSSNKLGGSFPAHFYRLSTLDLHNNSIAGPLPEVTAEGLPLKFFSVYGNELNGAIPDSIRMLKSLTHLDLSYNKFTDSIPGSALNELTNVTYLFLGRNDFDAGDIPGLWDLTKLQDLSLKGTAREGAIPNWIGDSLKELVLLDLHDNGFNSEIPGSLGTLSNLAYLLLNRNQLTGAIPDSFSGLENLEVLHLDKNQMEGDSDPICMSSLELDSFFTDCSDVTCDCCDACCAEDDLDCNGGEWSANIKDGYVRDQYVFSENIVFDAGTDSV